MLVCATKPIYGQGIENGWGGGGGGGSSVDCDLSMNECMGLSVRKMPLPIHKSNQEFGNNSKEKKTLPHHEQCLGLETLKNQ